LGAALFFFFEKRKLHAGREERQNNFVFQHNKICAALFHIAADALWSLHVFWFETQIYGAFLCFRASNGAFSNLAPKPCQRNQNARKKCVSANNKEFKI